MNYSNLKSIFLPFLLSCMLFTSPGLAWNSIGHKIIATIAYKNLNPSAQKKIDALTKHMDHYNSGLMRFIYISTWADNAASQKYPKTLNWHFIDYPILDKDFNGKIPRLKKANVIFAIKNAEKILKSKKAKTNTKAISLAFLIHLVGDIHQPLHCANYFSKNFPHGDGGGNLLIIDNSSKLNLHQYWDDELGIFTNSKDQKQKDLNKIAIRISSEYPERYFQGTANDLDINTWAQESHNLATNFAYKINTMPHQTYQNEGQEIVKTRLVLAGLRLAKLLNAIL